MERDGKRRSSCDRRGSGTAQYIIRAMCSLAATRRRVSSPGARVQQSVRTEIRVQEQMYSASDGSATSSSTRRRGPGRPARPAARPPPSVRRSREIRASSTGGRLSRRRASASRGSARPALRPDRSRPTTCGRWKPAARWPGPPTPSNGAARTFTTRRRSERRPAATRRGELDRAANWSRSGSTSRAASSTTTCGGSRTARTASRRAATS